MNREVAFKEIKPGRAGDSGSRGRFVLEAEITGGLEHPGIVPVYSLGSRTDGLPFYAMRFIRGDSLKEAITAFHSGATGGDAAVTPSAASPVASDNAALQFDDGSHRTIAFGPAPVKLHACRVSIDGTERVVLSPGLPEYDAIRNQCQPFEPTDSGQPLEPSGSGMNTTSVVSTIGILLSLLMYLAYVIITQF